MFKFVLLLLIVCCLSCDQVLTRALGDVDFDDDNAWSHNTESLVRRGTKSRGSGGGHGSSGGGSRDDKKKAFCQKKPLCCINGVPIHVDDPTLECWVKNDQY